MKNVQISKELFFELLKFHLCNIPDNEEYIRSELSAKIDRMANRERYENAMLAKSDVERRELLQQYYDMKNFQN